MRTTLTLDDDVAVMLRNLQKERELSLKDAVNQLLREALAHPQSNKRKPRFRTPTFSVGGSLLPNLDCVSQVLAIAEGDDHK